VPPGGDETRSSRSVGAGCDGTLRRQVILHPAKRSQRPAKSCGPGAATLASIHAAPWWRGNGGKKGRSPGRARSKPSNHCAGKAGMSWLYLSDPCAFFVALFAHGNAGAVGARLSLRPLSRRGTSNCRTRAKTSRGNESACLSAVVARLAAFAKASASLTARASSEPRRRRDWATQYSRDPVIEPMGRSVLDHQHARVVTSSNDDKSRTYPHGDKDCYAPSQ
jgi:hypothetical protein